MSRVALLNREKLNLGIDVFVAVKTNQHNLEWLAEFSRRVGEFREVVEFYRMAGESDYLLRVVVPDIPAFDSFYKKLVQTTDLADVSSNFAMEQIKYTTALPLQTPAVTNSANPARLNCARGGHSHPGQGTICCLYGKLFPINGLLEL